jgi:hypothetical protein
MNLIMITQESQCEPGHFHSHPIEDRFPEQMTREARERRGRMAWFAWLAITSAAGRQPSSEPSSALRFSVRTGGHGNLWSCKR